MKHCPECGYSEPTCWWLCPMCGYKDGDGNFSPDVPRTWTERIC